jgi:hypothetical protein
MSEEQGVAEVASVASPGEDTGTSKENNPDNQEVIAKDVELNVDGTAKEPAVEENPGKPEKTDEQREKDRLVTCRAVASKGGDFGTAAGLDNSSKRRRLSKSS